jgi:hypothetical protein
VSKTNSKSMLGYMNELTLNIEYHCRRFPSYESISLDYIENIHIDWLSFDKASNKYRTIIDYWMKTDMLIV